MIDVELEVLGRARDLAYPATRRAVMTLHYGEDRSLKEVAAILDVPLGTVKSRLGYGLSRLRAMLAKP